MNEYNMFLALIDDLNDGGKNLNACAYDEEFFVGARTVKICFYRNHRALYNRLLRHCAERGLVVISTHPATYETAVRIPEED